MLFLVMHRVAASQIRAMRAISRTITANSCRGCRFIVTCNTRNTFSEMSGYAPLCAQRAVIRRTIAPGPEFRCACDAQMISSLPVS